MLLAGVALCRLIYRAWSDAEEDGEEEEDVEAPPPVERPVHMPCTCTCAWHARVMHVPCMCYGYNSVSQLFGGRRVRECRLTPPWRPPCPPPRISHACHIGRRCPRLRRTPRASRGAGRTRAGEAPHPRARGAARGGPRRSACGGAAAALKAPWREADRSYFSAVYVLLIVSSAI